MVNETARGPQVVDPDIAVASRTRLVVFWIVAIVFVFLLLSDIIQTRPWYLLVPVTVWGGWGEVGAYPSHAIHMLMVALLHWAVVAAVLAQIVRPQQRIGAAWSYLILGVVTLGIALAYANLPPEAVPILSGVLVFALLAFLIHPSPMRAKFRSVAPPSRVLLALVVVGAVPLAMFAIDSFSIQMASGPGDEHYEFGHWTFMGIYPIVTVLIGLVAACKVSGWRLPGWIAGIFVLAHGLGSLLLTAASTLQTVWAIAAVVWGAGFILVTEAEANQTRQAQRPATAPPTPDVPPADG